MRTVLGRAMKEEKQQKNTKRTTSTAFNAGWSRITPGRTSAQKRMYPFSGRLTFSSVRPLPCLFPFVVAAPAPVVAADARPLAGADRGTLGGFAGGDAGAVPASPADLRAFFFLGGRSSSSLGSASRFDFFLDAAADASVFDDDFSFFFLDGSS